MYKYYLFDMDGTIIDSSIGITKSAKYALNKMNIEVTSLDSLLNFIGPPLYDSFKNYGLDENSINQAIEYFRKYFSEYGVHEYKLYDGIIEIFKELKQRNKILMIATSKVDIFTIQILKEADILKYFSFIGSATMDGKISKKKDVIKYVIESNSLNKNECLMIGDTKYDIIGANKNQIDSLGVLYGFGKKEELIKEGATFISNNIKDILNY